VVRLSKTDNGGQVELCVVEGSQGARV
jgi:hypothetical protein